VLGFQGRWSGREEVGGRRFIFSEQIFSLTGGRRVIGCCLLVFVKGKIGNQMMYNKSTFTTNSKPIVKIL
jgi:hypothetical protein